MQLRDAGKLDLEDTLDMHVDGAAHSPSIRRLLSHGSGIQRETQDDAWLKLRFASPDELLETLAEAEMVLPAGRALPLLEPRLRAARDRRRARVGDGRTRTTSASGCSSQSG